MDDLTVGELWARRKQLENEAAVQLGHMIFEISRLEMNLGLCLVWVEGGGKLESLTKSVESLSLKAKLDKLEEQVKANLPDRSTGREAYEHWLQRAHGRWGVEAHINKVVNVLGLPTSEEQQITRYGIDELVRINNELKALQCELSRLREDWPL